MKKLLLTILFLLLAIPISARQIAFLRWHEYECDAWVYDLQTKQETKVTNGHNVSDVTWYNKHSLLVVSDSDVWLVDLQTNKKLRLTFSKEVTGEVDCVENGNVFYQTHDTDAACYCLNIIEKEAGMGIYIPSRHIYGDFAFCVTDQYVYQGINKQTRDLNWDVRNKEFTIRRMQTSDINGDYPAENIFGFAYNPERIHDGTSCLGMDYNPKSNKLAYLLCTTCEGSDIMQYVLFDLALNKQGKPKSSYPHSVTSYNFRGTINSFCCGENADEYFLSMSPEEKGFSLYGYKYAIDAEENLINKPIFILKDVLHPQLQPEN